jgi:hypothetical protein
MNRLIRMVSAAQSYRCNAKVSVETQLRQTGEESARPRGIVGLLGAGTGLGVSGLVPTGNSWISGRPNPDLHRASDPQFAESGELERPQAAGCRFTRPPRPRRRQRRSMPLRRASGGANSRPSRLCGSANGSKSFPSSPIRPRYVESYIRQMPSRACTCHYARSSRRPLPERRSRQQTAVSGLAQHRKGLEDAAYHLAASSQSVRHSVRRALHLRHQLRFLTGLSTQNS